MFRKPYRFGNLVAEQFFCCYLRFINQFAESAQVPSGKRVSGLRDDKLRLQPELFEAVELPFGLSSAIATKSIA